MHVNTSHCIVAMSCLVQCGLKYWTCLNDWKPGENLCRQRERTNSTQKDLIADQTQKYHWCHHWPFCEELAYNEIRTNKGLRSLCVLPSVMTVYCSFILGVYEIFLPWSLSIVLLHSAFFCVFTLWAHIFHFDLLYCTCLPCKRVLQMCLLGFWRPRLLF